MSDCIPTHEARDEFIDAVKARGNTIAYGNPLTLQLDLDDGAAFERAVMMIQRFSKHLNIRKAGWDYSKSGAPHRHVYVMVGAPLSPEERIFWQAALGSDPVREALNMLWVRGGHEGECFLEVSSSAILHPIEIGEPSGNQSTEEGSG